MSSIELTQECKYMGKTAVCHAVCITIDSEMYCKVRQQSSKSDLVDNGLLIVLAICCVLLLAIAIGGIVAAFKGV